MFGRVKNNGPTAFDVFKVYAKATDDPGDDWVDITAVAALVTTSAGIATLGSGLVGWFLLTTGGLYKIRVIASSITGAVTADAFASGW